MLREAIDMGGLRLHFQPEVDLRTGKVLAAEALVRWETRRAASWRPQVHHGR